MYRISAGTQMRKSHSTKLVNAVVIKTNFARKKVSSSKARAKGLLIMVVVATRRWMQVGGRGERGTKAFAARRRGERIPEGWAEEIVCRVR